VLQRVYRDAWQMRGLFSDLSADLLEVEECSPTRRTRHIFLQHSSKVTKWLRLYSVVSRDNHEVLFFLFE
jgi:hypothetical protein